MRGECASCFARKLAVVPGRQLTTQAALDADADREAAVRKAAGGVSVRAPLLPAARVRRRGRGPAVPRARPCKLHAGAAARDARLARSRGRRRHRHGPGYTARAPAGRRAPRRRRGARRPRCPAGPHRGEDTRRVRLPERRPAQSVRRPAATQGWCWCWRRRAARQGCGRGCGARRGRRRGLWVGSRRAAAAAGVPARRSRGRRRPPGTRQLARAQSQPQPDTRLAPIEQQGTGCIRATLLHTRRGHGTVQHLELLTSFCFVFVWSGPGGGGGARTTRPNAVLQGQRVGAGWGCCA